MISTSLDRASAVKQLSGPVFDRHSFLVAVSLRRLAEQVHAFGDGTVPVWTAYIDHGGSAVLRTSDVNLLEAHTRSVPGSAVLVIPKTVPATALREVFGQPLPEDGSRDLIDLDTDFWPTLVFEALEAVNPEAAAFVRSAYPENGRPEVPGV
jgi:hypothetical protein